MRAYRSLFGTAMAVVMLAGLLAAPARAKFEPKFTVSLSNTTVLGNPQLTFHLEFAADDEEIGYFTGTIPKGFSIAPDEAIANDEQIGAGQVTIQGGPSCRPGAPQGFSVPATINATFLEKDRTEGEIDEGVYSVWFLDIEPVNRVRLLVRGSKKTGWTVEGAPTPSDNTCNPLIVDLNIYPKSESGVAIITNPKRPRPKKFTADIQSQDSPTVAHFEQIIEITR